MECDDCDAEAVCVAQIIWIDSTEEPNSLVYLCLDHAHERYGNVVLGDD